MLFSILRLFFSVSLGMAQESPTDVSVSLSFYSINNQTGMTLYNTDATPQKGLSLDPRLARLSFLDEEHIRFELHNPVHLQLAWDNGTAAESIFRSVVVKAPAEDVEAALSLLGQNYFSYERDVPARINTFLEQSDGGQYDALIRRYITLIERSENVKASET